MHAPCFIADAALGRLVKWLRIAGFDTIYDPLLTVAGARDYLQKGRTLLTRKQALYSELASKGAVLIRSDHYPEQIREVSRATGLGPKHLNPFSRCTKCNLLTVSISREDVFGKVPDYIWEHARSFHTCNGCRRIYWRGSHTERSLAVLANFKC